jgi:hypothetical protein
MISGETNNSKVAKTYQNCLPGDSPELMAPDNHLFGDLQEGAAKNVALTYHIHEDHDDAAIKYSFATPHKVYDALQRTILAGCPSPTRIADDINRVFTETLTRIIEAKGTYIEDFSNKSTRHGVRAQHAAAVTKKSETLPVDAAATDAFIRMVKSMKDGGGVSFKFDTKGEGDEGTSATTLERRVNEDEEKEDEGERV